MKYINDNVRRQDRLLSEERARELLHEREQGVLSMVDEEGKAYGVPVNFVFDGTSAIYIHCAPEGKKLRAIAAHPDVTFCIVGYTHLMPELFTTEYESIILRGRASTGLSAEEKMMALHLFVDRLSPDYQQLGRIYSQKSFHRVEIIRIDITEFSGKCKRSVRPVSFDDAKH